MVVNTEGVFQKGLFTPGLRAFQLLAPLPGQSRSLLALGSGLQYWVIKFVNNPQHGRLVLTEFIASRTAIALGLSVPPCSFIQVNATVLEEAKDRIRLDPRFHTPGLHFASLYVLDRKAAPLVNGCDLQDVSNLEEVLGAFVLDVWFGNEDYRQVVFAPERGGVGRRAWWIDFGHCFGAGRWEASSWQPSAQVSNEGLYQAFDDWAAFQGWIERIEAFTTEDLKSIVGKVPRQLTEGQEVSLDHLVLRLERRRERLRSLLVAAITRAQELRTWRQRPLSQKCFSPLFLAEHLEGDLYPDFQL